MQIRLQAELLPVTGLPLRAIVDVVGAAPPSRSADGAPKLHKAYRLLLFWKSVVVSRKCFFLNYG